jgi:hypothetical protein
MRQTPEVIAQSFARFNHLADVYVFASPREVLRFRHNQNHQPKILAYCNDVKVLTRQLRHRTATRTYKRQSDTLSNVPQSPYSPISSLTRSQTFLKNIPHRILIFGKTK